MRKRVMIVEDYPAIAMDEEFILKRLNYEVVGITFSGEAAVEMAGELHPDVVLMDVALAGQMDGVQAAREIRAVSDIPVVFVTAFGDKDKSNFALPPVGYGYVVKPYTMGEIEETFNTVLAL